MFGGVPRTAGRFAIAAAAGIFVGGVALAPAQAADLGGDCCADLEERVAELEATTVRKGNSKVSLKLAGQVTKAILFWDDGIDDDVYIGDNDISGTRFKLSGSAIVNPGLEIGFYVEYDIQSNALNALNQFDANNNDADLIDASDANIFFRGSWGRLTFGRLDDANQGIEEIDLSGSGIVADGAPDDAIAGMFVRATDGSVALDTTWSGVAPWAIADGGESEGIKYDLPTIAGFTLSASWTEAGADAAGEEEHYDIALRFAQEFGGTVRVAAGIGHSSDKEDDEAWGGSAAILHIPTGLNAAFSYGHGEDSTGEESDRYWVKLGLLGQWTPLGKTAIYGEYGHYETDTQLDIDFIDPSDVGEDSPAINGNASIVNPEAEIWGFGIVQNIDAAATELYIAYRHYEADGTLLDTDDVLVPEDAFDIVLAGARIKF